MHALRSSKVPVADELTALKTEHESLDVRLRQLDRHLSLSPEEQYEMQVIKKRKLAIKDRIANLEN
ncbi:MAG: YdcH family protein [bacterium]